MDHEPLNLDIRTVNFSKSVLAFCKAETLTAINRPLIDQLIRSTTSIGANYAEANNAASKTDFRNKIFIAKKEAAEAKYWLTLLEDIAKDKETCSELLRECHFILMTLQKIISTMANGKRLTYSER